MKKKGDKTLIIVIKFINEKEYRSKNHLTIRKPTRNSQQQKLNRNQQKSEDNQIP